MFYVRSKSLDKNLSEAGIPNLDQWISFKEFWNLPQSYMQNSVCEQFFFWKEGM